jgi:dethiobiotin synthetase
MAKGYFVTGTDTGVGKSWCSTGLMVKLKQQGHKVAGMKPVASGCEQTSKGLRNEDALLLQAEASIELPYATINPYAFEAAIAPHIAAQQSGDAIEFTTIAAQLNEITAEVDKVIVEGVGGWQVPLNEHETVADLAKALGLPVIMVVGLRLGCINHALLTAEAIRNDGCELAGWIANSLEAQMVEQEAVVATLERRLEAPLLGVVPYQSQIDVNGIAAALSLSSIKN